MIPRRRTLVVHDLGLVEYEDGLALQKAFAAARRGGAAPDTLLLLEHPPVLTLGRGAKREHLLASPAELERVGVAVHETDRGGDVTYHGPGQVVGYPIIDLSPDRCDVRRYVSDLEEAMILAAQDFGVPAKRIEGWVGVWLGEKGRDARKLGAIGVHISRWITTHGFAFNVRPDLSHFKLIVPCGIGEAGVTSIEKERGEAPPMGAARDALARHLSERLGARLVWGRFAQRTVSVAVLRPRGDGIEALVLRRHPHRGGFWQPVTGTMEPKETPLDCARRELREETGIPGEVIPLDYVHAFLFGEPRPDRPPRIFRETGFWTLVDGDPEVRLDKSEHCASEWVPIEEAVARVPFAGLRQALRRSGRAALQRLASRTTSSRGA